MAGAMILAFVGMALMAASCRVGGLILWAIGLVMVGAALGSLLSELR